METLQKHFPLDNNFTSEAGDIGKYEMLPKYNVIFLKRSNAGI